MDEQPRNVISRRSALKGIGAGTTLAWATPAIASIRLPARAPFSGQSGDVPYGSCGWLFKQVDHGGDAGFEAPGFDDSDFSSGCGAFGHDVGGCGLTTQTNWDLNTDMLLRRSVTIPSGATMVTVGVAIDNDVFVYWDGSLIGSLIHEGCAAFDSLVATAPSTPGSHILAVRGIDRGIVSFLDVSVNVS